MKSILFMLALLLHLHAVAADNLIIYDAPRGVAAAPEFDLEVNGKKVFVYNERSAAVAYFSFEGTARIKVTFASPVYNHDIRPKSLKLNSEVSRNVIQFVLEKPANISVEINKNLKRPLFIFANPLEKNIPDKNKSDVIFFEGGKIHTPGIVQVKSNQTVYIAGGAVVRGSFMLDSVKNVKILGRGIIDNSMYRTSEARPIEINRSSEVLLEGFTITEAKHWTCASIGSSNITYRNMKVVSDNDYDDGIDISGSQNVLVDNCFIKTKDDCIAIKAGVTYYTKHYNSKPVDNIMIQNSVFWNGVWGNALEIGFETRTDTIRNVTFKNCDIIHVEGPEGTFTIHNGDRAMVKNVRYEDIRVEDARGWLIDFRILQSRYSKDLKRGRIEDVYFKNIFVEGENYPYSQLIGFDEASNIKNVTLDNFNIHGNRINSIYNGLISSHHIENLVFK